MLRQLSKETLYYAIGNFFQRGTAFILVIVYTSALSITVYGQYETLYTIVQALILLLNFGLSIALIRYCVDCKNEQEIDILVRTSTLLCLILSSISFLFILPMLPSMGKAFLGSKQSVTLLALAFFWAIGSSLNLQLFSYYRARRKVFTFLKLSFTNFVSLILVNLILVYLVGLGLLGILLANILIVWVLNLAMSLGFWLRGRSVSLAWGKKLLAYGFPLIFTGMAMLVLNSGDRMFLAYYRSFPEVAVYSLGYKVGLIAQIMVVQPFELAWAPYVFNHYAAKKGEAKPDYARIFTYLMIIFCFAGVGLFIFTPEVVALLGSGKIAESAAVVPYVIIAYLFYSIFCWASTFIMLVEKNIYLTVIAILIAGVNTFLNRLWIPTLGWHGAAISTIICFLGLALLTMLTVRSLFPIQLEWRRLVILLLLVIVTVSVSLFIPQNGNLESWLLRLAVLLVIPSGLLILRFFLPEEIAVVHVLVSKIKSFSNY